MKLLPTVLLTALVIAGWQPAAKACNYLPPEPLVVDPVEVAVDTTPPGALSVLSVVVTRDPSRHGMSCWDSSARITLVEPTDDRTAANDLAFLLEVVDGTSPQFLSTFFPGPRVLGSSREAGDFGITLPWMEDDPDAAVLVPIKFTLRITPIDRAGNHGPSTDVVVADPSVEKGDGGCNATGRDNRLGLTSLLLTSIFGAILASVLRRRTHRVGGPFSTVRT
jgi:hypothetical protein